MSYQHTQYGYLAVPVLPFYVVVLGLLIIDDASPAPALILAVVVMVFTLGLVLVFSRLTVTVSDDTVTAAFGYGKPSRQVELGEVTEARMVRNHWYLGFGVRKIPKGWMYNVWGLDAVELQLRDGRVFRIGTNDPEGLQAAVALRRRP